MLLIGLIRTKIGEGKVSGPNSFTPATISIPRSPLGTPRFSYLVRIGDTPWAFKHRMEVNRLPSQAKAIELDPALIDETPNSLAGAFTYRGRVPTDWSVQTAKVASSNLPGGAGGR
jgi:hypothetical protein